MTSASVEAVLTALQAVQVVFLLLHDWVPLGRLSNLAAVHAVDSTSKLLWTTLISALPYAAGLGFCIARFLIWPAWLHIYLDVLYAVRLLSLTRQHRQ